jgi:hypothetical protein
MKGLAEKMCKNDFLRLLFGGRIVNADGLWQHLQVVKHGVVVYSFFLDAKRIGPGGGWHPIEWYAACAYL